MPTSKLAEYFGKAIAKEVPAEMATTTAQFGVETTPGIGLTPDATATDLVKQLADTVIQTILQTGTLGGASFVASEARKAIPKIGAGERDVTIPPSQRPSPTISGEGIPISGRPERTLAPEGVAGAEPPPVGVPSVPAVEPVQGEGAPPPALDVRKEIDTLLDEYATINPVAAGEFRTLFIDPNATYTQDDVDIVREIVNDARRLKEEETPSAVTPTEAQQAKEEGAAAPAEGTEVAGAPTPAAKTADQLQDEIRDLEQQRLALLTKNGRVPAVKSKARAKYDALGEQVDALMGQWDKTDRAERAAKKPAEAPPTEVTQPFNEFEQQEYDLAQRLIALPNTQAVAFGEGILMRLQGPLRSKIKSNQKTVDFATERLKKFETPTLTEPTSTTNTLRDTLRNDTPRERLLLDQYTKETSTKRQAEGLAPAGKVIADINTAIKAINDVMRQAGFMPYDGANIRANASKPIKELYRLGIILSAGGYSLLTQRLAQDRGYKTFSLNKLNRLYAETEKDLALVQAKLQELATGKRTIEQVRQERDALLAEQQTLRTSTGKPPAVRSPARRKYDALTERINQLYDEELRLTPKEPTKVEEVTTKDLQDRVANIKATIAETEAELAAATEDGNIEALENRLDALEKDLKNAQLDLREKIEAQREEGLDFFDITGATDVSDKGGTAPVSLRRTIRRLRKALNEDQIDSDTYAAEVNAAYDETSKEGKAPADLVRGQLNIRERLLRAVRNGQLPEEALELAEWFIKQNSTLPILQVEISKNGRSDFNFNQALNGINKVYISLFDPDSKTYRVTSKECYITSEESPTNPTDIIYYANYQFTNRETSKIGRFEVELSLIDSYNDLVLPLSEKLYINIVDSFSIKNNTFKNEYELTPPC